MARSNKYTPLNFNGIFEKKLSNEGATSPIAAPKSFPNQTKTLLSNSRIHGNMLVLSRPAPKSPSAQNNPETRDKFPPLSSASSPNQPKPPLSDPDPVPLNPPSSIPAINPSPVKSDRFVPPHLRPGFVPREEKPTKGVEIGRKPEPRGHRPASIHRAGGFAPEVFERRPISGGGNRPSSSG